MAIKPKKIAGNIKRIEEFLRQASTLRLREDIPLQAWDLGDGRIMETEPGQIIPVEVLKKFKIDPAILHPDSLRNKDSFEFAFKHKKQFSVSIIRDMNGRGDVLMASVIAKALKYKYGADVKIYFVVQRGYERILKYNPWIDEVFIDRKEMAMRNPDIEFNVNNLEFKAELKEFKEQHRVNRNRATIYLNNMDLFLENKTPLYVVSAEEREWAFGELESLGFDIDKPIIGLEKEGSNATRTYPQMGRVKGLLEEDGYQVLYLDDKDRHGNYKYSVEQVGALVEQITITVAPNSYFYHLAGAMKKRATAIFGSCDGDVWTEDYEKTNLAQMEQCPEKKVGEGKCWWELRCLEGKNLQEKEKTHSPPCLADITPKLVVEKVKEHFEAKKILVVVLTYELLELTKQMIDSVRSFHDYDILIIDNESTDSTIEYMEENRIECISEKMTVPEAWNRGMLEAYNRGYDYVLLCNNDIILAPNYIDTVIEVAERRQASAVTGKVINKSEKITQMEFSHKVEPVEYPVTTMVAGDYSAILLGRRCIEEVGAFRVFGKRYQADEDHVLRLRLWGDNLIKTHTATFLHLLGAVVHTIPEEAMDKQNDWEKGIEAFKKEWKVNPYTERMQLHSLGGMKKMNPDWKKKIKISIKGLKKNV